MPDRILLYGEEKVGKSTWAKDAPKTAYIAFDSGTAALHIRGRLPTPATLAELYELLAELEAGPAAHGYEHLVIDTANWLEDRLEREMLAEQPGKTMKAWGGGFNAGPRELARRWKELLARIERVWASGVGIIFIAHRLVVEFKDPQGADYKRFVPALRNEEIRGSLKQWCDAIFHAQLDTYGHAGEDGKVKARGTGARVLATEFSPAADAGNRWTLPAELPLSYDAYAKARAEQAEREAKLLEQIEVHLKTLADTALEGDVRKALADGKSVEAIENRLAARVAAKQETENKQ